MRTKEFLTVSELNGLIQEVIQYGFPNSVWVCGEIQGFDRNREKKHIFFELCEKDPQSKDIVARIGMVIFAQRKAYLEEILKSAENAFQLKDDIEVKFLCKVDFYPPHGALRLIVESIDPIYTLGKIAQERQKLIALLKGRGILEQNKKISLPPVPLRIGLVTAYDSAAYNDFLSELKRSGFGFKIFFMNSLMQGKGAEASVCAALEKLNLFKNLDAIVITRGGGSIAELSCFDSQKIAETIAASRRPVLSGIGHEINITITDLAAHTYAKTPTAIAQFLVEWVQDFLIEGDEKLEAIVQLARDRLDADTRRLRLLALGMHQRTIHFLKSHQEGMARLGTVLKRQPFQTLKGQRREMEGRQTLLAKVMKMRFAQTHEEIENYKKLVEIVSPRNTLRRGFSITRNRQGKLIRRTQEAPPGTAITTELTDGILESRVSANSYH